MSEFARCLVCTRNRDSPWSQAESGPVSVHLHDTAVSRWRMYHEHGSSFFANQSATL